VSFSAEQSRRLDEVVGNLASEVLEPAAKLIREFSDEAMENRFGEGVVDVPALLPTKTRLRIITEEEVVQELARRLAARLINPHVTA